MPARDHTYFIASRARTLGVHADAAPLAAALGEAWTRHAGDAEPGPVDGVSVWRDDAGGIQLRLVKSAAATVLDDGALRSAAERALGIA